MGWQTHLITCCTCFLAGSTFHHWVADHNTLWLNPTTEEAVSRAIKYYVLLGSVRHTPLPYLWLATAGVAVVTLIWRMAHHKGEKFTGGFLFDAGCCLLLAEVIVLQATDIFPALLAISDKVSHETINPTAIIGESSVRELAGTNLTISVLLTGVCLLQAGRFYAERAAAKKRAKDKDAQDKLASEKQEKAAAVDATQSSQDAIEARPDPRLNRRPSTPFRRMNELEGDSPDVSDSN